MALSHLLHTPNSFGFFPTSQLLFGSLLPLSHRYKCLQGCFSRHFLYDKPHLIWWINNATDSSTSFFTYIFIPLLSASIFGFTGISAFTSYRRLKHHSYNLNWSIHIHLFSLTSYLFWWHLIADYRLHSKSQAFTSPTSVHQNKKIAKFSGICSPWISCRLCFSFYFFLLWP